MCIQLKHLVASIVYILYCASEILRRLLSMNAFVLMRVVNRLLCATLREAYQRINLLISFSASDSNWYIVRHHHLQHRLHDISFHAAVVQLGRSRNN